MHHNYRSLPFILLHGTILGSNLVVSRFSLGQFDPLTFKTLQLAVGALGMACLVIFNRKRQWSNDPGMWLRAGFWGIIGAAVPMSAIMFSLKYQSSGVTSLIISLSPVLIMVMAHLFLSDEHLTPRKMVGVIIALGGAALILVRGETGLVELTRSDWRGYFWAGLATFSASAGVVYARRFLNGYDTFDVASARMVVGAGALLPLALGIEHFDISRVTSEGWIVMAYAGLSGVFFAFMLDFYIIKRFGASFTAQTGYVITVAATVFGMLFLGEVVTPVILLGMAAIFTGIAIIN